MKAPGIDESPVNIECRVNEIKELGSHSMFIADVVGVTVDEMQQLLKLSHNQELYPRYQRDYVILCGINTGMSLYEIDEELKKRGIKDILEKPE